MCEGGLPVLQDLVKDAAPFWKKAKKFYEGVAKQLVVQGHALDVFACSLDQVGLAEMKVPVEATGGLVVQTDTFHNPVFKESLKRIFARPGEMQHLRLSSNATFEVRASKAGMLQPRHSTEEVVAPVRQLSSRVPCAGDSIPDRR